MGHDGKKEVEACGLPCFDRVCSYRKHAVPTRYIWYRW